MFYFLCWCCHGNQAEVSFGSQLSVLQEIRCLLCSYLHHTFIDQPNLVKLLHFQVNN